MLSISLTIFVTKNPHSFILYRSVFFETYSDTSYFESLRLGPEDFDDIDWAAEHWMMALNTPPKNTTWVEAEVLIVRQSTQFQSVRMVSLT